MTKLYRVPVLSLALTLLISSVPFAQETPQPERFQIVRHDGGVTIVPARDGNIRTPDELFQALKTLPPTVTTHASVAPTKTLAAFVVSDPGDAADTDINDGIFSPATLRSAIQNAVKVGGSSTISFSPGLTTVSVISPLPSLTVPATIDGSVAAGKVIIDGTGFVGSTGLIISSSSTVQNTSWRNFPNAALSFGIGTTNIAVRRNEFFSNKIGLNLNSTGGTIGGPNPEDRNIVAQNTQTGISLVFANDLVIQNNFVGTKDGTTAAANTGDGLYIYGSRNRVLNNLLSGNSETGLSIGEFSEQTLVRDNIIGLDSSGQYALGNLYYGVEIMGSKDSIISNVISGNGWGIIHSYQADQTLIRGNIIGPTKGLDSLRQNTSGGIYLVGTPVTVDSNLISGNNWYGININGYGGATVTRNKIGTDPSGTTSWANKGPGVNIICDNNIIGGPNPSDGNLISGNQWGGIEMFGGTTLVFGGPSQPNMVQGNIIQNNIIGADITGTQSVSNFTGLFMNGNIDSNFVRDNLISGNRNHGVWTRRSPNAPSRNTFQRNRIGTTADGLSPLPNDSCGIMVDSARMNLFGGPNEGDGNIIAFSNQAGIAVKAGWGMKIQRNSIFSNKGMAIDHRFDGPTPNDSGDVDDGPNRLMNYPRITWIHNAGGSTTVKGRLESRPSTTFQVEFYTNDSADSTGFGEAQTFQKVIEVTTDTAGIAAFETTITGSYGRVVGTATHPDDGTSEVSKSPFVVNSTADRPDADPQDGLASTNGPLVNGAPEVTLRSALQASNHVLGEDDVTFDISGGGAQFIAPQSGYPTVNGDVYIDGSTQPGFVAGQVQVIRVQGGNAGANTDGFNFNGDRTTVRGIYIASFTGNGIDMSGERITLIDVTSNANKRSGVRAAHDVTLEGESIFSGNGPSTDRTSNICDTRQTAGLWLAGMLRGTGKVTASQNCGAGIHHDGSAGLDDTAIDLHASVIASNNSTVGLNGSGPVTLKGERFEFSGNGSLRTSGNGVWMANSGSDLLIEASGPGTLPNILVQNNSNTGIYTMGGKISLKGRAVVSGNGITVPMVRRFNDDISGLYTNGSGDIHATDLTVENNGFMGIKAGGSLFMKGNLVVKNHVNKGIWAVENIDIDGTEHVLEKNGDQAMWAANGWIRVKGRMTVRDNTYGGTGRVEPPSDAGNVIVGSVMADKNIVMGDIVFENNEPSGLTSRANILIRGNAIVRNSRLRGIFAYDQVTIIGASHEISGSGGDGISCNNGPLIVRGALTLLNNGKIAGTTDSDAGDGVFGPTVVLDDVTSRGNAHNGLSAHGGGVTIRGRALIVGNGMHGIGTNGPALLSGGRIADNAGYGIAASSVRLSGTQVSNNTLGGVAGKGPASSGGGRVLYRTTAGLPAYPLSVIQGSSITDNGGDGINLEGARAFAVNGNNISGNAGFGVKVSGGGTVNADQNWWGSPSGPGAAISGAVSAATWQSSAVGMYAGINFDSVFVRPGDSLDLPAVLANWSTPADSFNVDVSDEDGWLTPIAGRVVAMKDSTPAVTSMILQVPQGAAVGDTSRAILSAGSLTTSATAADTFMIIVYTPGLRHVAILSDTVRIVPGDTMQLFVVGLDQAGRELPIVPLWTADGGSVSSTGRFVAGAGEGTFIVRVVDSASGYKDSTVIVVLSPPAAVPAGTLLISAVSVEVGNVAPGQQKTVSILATNTAGGILSVDSVKTLTPYFAAVRDPDVGLLRAGDTIAVAITFSPDSLRAYTDTLYVYHTDSATSPRKLVLTGSGQTTLVEEASEVPMAYELAQNYPNPFNPTTTIRFGLPVASRVRLTVHDLLGREIARLVDGVQKEGFVTVTWTPQAASGVYFFRMDASSVSNTTERFTQVRRMVLVK